MSEHRVWIRSAAEGKRDRYRYRAACTCGWVGPVRDDRLACLPDRNEHAETHDDEATFGLTEGPHDYRTPSQWVEEA